MATHVPARQLVPKPGHSGHALVPIGMASGIPRINTSRTSSTIPTFNAAERSMARFMLALTVSAIYPGETAARTSTAIAHTLATSACSARRRLRPSPQEVRAIPSR
jgi:hypothetical protein